MQVLTGGVSEREPLRRSWPVRGLRVTFGGMLYLVVLLVVTLAALNSEANLLLLLAGIGVGVFVFSGLLALDSVRQVRVQRIVPPAVMAGRPFQIAYTVQSRRRWRRNWSLVVGEAGVDRWGMCLGQVFVRVLEPGQEVRAEAHGLLPQRGSVDLKRVRVLSRFPLGLFSCHVDFAGPGQLVVYPIIGRFRRDPWKDSRYGGSTPQQGRRRDHMEDEFWGLREYRQGDNYHLIHWRRSARTGELVVREMMPTRQEQLVVIADPWPTESKPARRRGRQLDQRAEEAIAGAAVAVCEGLERGHQVGLVCRSQRPVLIPGSAGRLQRRRLLHELALLQPGQGESLFQLIGGIRWLGGWHVHCVLCVGRFTHEHEQVLRLLGRQAESVTVLQAQTESFRSLVELEGGRRV